MFQQLSADADKEKNEHRSPAVKINVRNQEEDDVFEEGNKESEKRPVLEETGVANAGDNKPLASNAGSRLFVLWGHPTAT